MKLYELNVLGLAYTSVCNDSSDRCSRSSFMASFMASFMVYGMIPSQSDHLVDTNALSAVQWYVLSGMMGGSSSESNCSINSKGRYT